MRKHSATILMVFWILVAYTQDVLTIQEAIAMALENNYAIVISKNEAAISSNNVSKGNAGMLPLVSLHAGTNFSGNNTQQEFVTGNNVDKKGAKSNNINSGVELNWILFDGMKMFISYDKLKELDKLGTIATKMQIENIVVEVIASYFEIVRQKQLLKVNENLISIHEERVKVSKTRWEIGKAAKTDYLQAQLDFNSQKTARINLFSNLTAMKINLNQTLSRLPETEFDVTDEIDLNRKLKMVELNADSKEMNHAISFYQSNIAINEFSLREFKAERFPDISLNANYNFSRTKNQAGFLLYNQNLGWNVGLSAHWILFNGYNINRNIKNAEINLKIAQVQLDNIKLEIQSSLSRSFKNYQAAIEALTMEEENTILAKEYLGILLESFRLGKANTLEFKEAQRSYENALTNLLQTRYDAKIAETELLKLKGELVK